MKQYLPAATIMLLVYWWLNRKHRTPININVKRRQRNAVNKMANQMSKTPNVKGPVEYVLKRKTYIQNKQKGRAIANSMSLRSASKSFNKQKKK
jgi:hypothetical protein